MACVDSMSTSLCDICGAMLWWTEVERHQTWHERIEHAVASTLERESYELEQREVGVKETEQ